MRPYAWSVFANILILSVLCFSAGNAAGPSIFWASQPVQPGSIVLFYGDGLEDADEIRFIRLNDRAVESLEPSQLAMSPADGISSKPLQHSNASVKAIIPQDLEPGVFAAWIHTPGGWSRPILLNDPNPWWVQGDCGAFASPGGWIRILGTGLAEAQEGHSQPVIVLSKETENQTFFLHPDESSMYNLEVKLPMAIPEGRYRVWLHNGRGGQEALNGDQFIEIREKPQMPSTVFNVKDFGAAGNGDNDDTGAIVKALSAVGENGGGVIFFPRGFYKITSSLEIPPKTAIRGERQDLVDLFWPDGKEMLPYIMKVSKVFCLENLTMHFGYTLTGIINKGSAAENGDFFMRKVRIRYLMFSGHLTLEDVAERFRATGDYQGGFRMELIQLTGKNITVTDCDLYSSGMTLALKAVEGVCIANNLLYNGRWGWYNLNGAEKVLFENNQITGADLMSCGGGIATYGVSPARFIYFAHNTFKNIYGWDRESMTLDAGGGDYIGPIKSATENSITYPVSQGWEKNALKGRALYIMDGKGKGQFRMIIANTGDTITTEHPWDVLPDASSVAGITWMRGNLLFIGNESSDASITIQLYGVGLNVIVAENKSSRAGGFRSYAMRYLGNYKVPITQGIQPQMFVQFLNNEIVEGSSYHMGRNDGSIIGLSAGAPAEDWKWPIALAFLFRGNMIDSFGSIQLSTNGEGIPIIDDVVIQDNRIKDSSVGIEIGSRTQRVLLNGNTLKDVATPLLDHSKGAEEIPSK